MSVYNGRSKTKLYKSWVCMKRRCDAPDEHHKKYYEQLQNYADALRGMGVEKVIEPYLVYISKEDEKAE